VTVKDPQWPTEVKAIWEREVKREAGELAKDLK
jgi:hypothetical protein